MIYAVISYCMTLTAVQFNFAAAVSGSVCQVNDRSGCSCQ